MNLPNLFGGATMQTQTTDIIVPDAATNPSAYVEALLRILDNRDPLGVLAATPEEAQRMLDATPDRNLLVNARDGEWSFRDVLGHLFDVDIVYGFRFRLALTADN